MLTSDSVTQSNGIVQPPAKSMSQWPWFAILVRSRQEMVIADHLHAIGYESFLPLYKIRRLWSDRIKYVDSPLFPGYIFCRFNSQNWLPILKSPGVIRVVGYNRIPIPIEDFEIEAIRTLSASGLPNQPWPFPKIGDRVRIVSGPLRGIEGILVEFKNRRQFVVSVTLLQRSVAVQIESSCVTSLCATSCLYHGT